ncbi:MAG: ABC transporter permease [Candidatus Competibacter denitrificans]|jgi:ABC-2 type transport system permease protein|uniref:Transport permease protein n=1 Tax=Candidatus Competibacter denitrificans Run_A_D11 TaxID=1400863 RepID=W6M3P0_9GAMM|nr:ABC transporter permease [Candidatus Competibacter denitrificans]CDI02257.1 ABC-2 [Candidatus Competibacter denitrificans Run_A_D11]HRC69362.1 ABC transporter permease [Candidatus Competibacter denitrificans]
MTALSPQRIGALVLRYLYLLRGSWIRVIELAYWPTVQMVLWGFITRYLAGHSDVLYQASGLLLSGVLLWDILFRSQLGVSVVFFEELHSRNLGQLFISPLQPIELILALMLVSLARTLLGVGVAVLLAMPFYGFNLFQLGPPLLGFFVNLLMLGWAIGLMVSALVLRYGMGAESIAWAAIFAIAPLCGIYYPVATLPDWLQPLSWALPASHVFEGMRTVLLEHRFRLDFLLYALALNAVYLSLGASLFLAALHKARERGSLLQSGE